MNRLVETSEIEPVALNTLLNSLRAAAEPTRLRLLAICAQGEWTVSELTTMLGQSQPRISRHLKILADGGLVDRFREGSWVFYRRAHIGEAGRVARSLCRLLPEDDPELLRDRQRMQRVRQTRREQAESFFARQAPAWDDEQAFAIDDGEVDRLILELLARERIPNLLDIGTGTGRVLRVLAPHVEFGLGVDLSPEMLAVARSNLDRREARNCQVRLADMYQLPLPNAGFEAAVLHQVLHYADDPLAVLREAARVLRPAGRLIVVDLAAHQDERLRMEKAHRRLGFALAEMAGWFEMAGFVSDPPTLMQGHGHDILVWDAKRVGEDDWLALNPSIEMA
ncbi:MAG: metalloregulator ArsR/SmtB family transcription factor, partial [Pseudomonadota bacterium]